MTEGFPARGDSVVRKQVVLVSRVKRNPYVRLLCEGLKAASPGLRPRVIDHFSLAWMWQHRRSVGILHLHWLELLFVYPTWPHSLRRWVSVMLGLVVARLSSVCVVYTVHNLSQHERHRRLLAWLGNRIVFALANAVHVHDDETADLLAQMWARRGGVHVIPHGNYVRAYPNHCSRATARAHLGLPDHAFAYLFFGRIRPYKGLEELIAAFGRLDDEDALLYIAGEVQEPGYEDVLSPLLASDHRIVARFEFVEDDQVQFQMNACDVCVLPYRHVTTSGAALLSFSFGVPAVAPRLGCFSDLIGEREERGILYDPDLATGLLDALRRCRQIDLTEKREACWRYVQDLNWEHIAARHAAMYRTCTEET